MAVEVNVTGVARSYKIRDTLKYATDASCISKRKLLNDDIFPIHSDRDTDNESLNGAVDRSNIPTKRLNDGCKKSSQVNDQPINNKIPAKQLNDVRKRASGIINKYPENDAFVYKKVVSGKTSYVEKGVSKKSLHN